MTRSRSTRQDRCGLLPVLHTAGSHRRCRAGNITALLNASLPGQTATQHPPSFGQEPR